MRDLAILKILMAGLPIDAACKYPAELSGGMRMRAAIARHNGHVFKTIGDAFCAVFTLAEDGLAAALDAQRTLAATDF